MNTSKTDHGITANLKEVVLDEGVLLFEVHAEIDDSEDDQQGKSAPISSFANTGVSLESGKNHNKWSKIG